MPFTQLQAAIELARRSMPKPRPAAATPEVFYATGAELRAIAGSTPVATTRTVVAVPKGEPVAKARLVGIGAKGGDVRWGIASALSKGQGYAARKALHDRLAKAGPQAVRTFAASKGLTIAPSVTDEQIGARVA